MTSSAVRNAKSQRASRGHVRSMVLGIAAVASCASVAILASSSMGNARLHVQTNEPTQQHVIAFLGELGLTPAPIAASGATTQETTAIVTEAIGYLEQHAVTLNEARLAVATKRASLEALRQQKARGENVGSESLSTAEEDLAIATAAHRQGMSTAFSACAASLTEPQRALLIHLRDNRFEGLSLPDRATDRTEAAALALRAARSAASCLPAGTNAPQSNASSILSACTNGTTTTVAANLENQASVSAAWFAALPQPE